ncbi:hypothetical protein TNCV_3995311 [Trichonephila clavipes]|nr:hypothetical protein TNCV_3995311 [Trichonephila clavipes]
MRHITTEMLVRPDYWCEGYRLLLSCLLCCILKSSDSSFERVQVGYVRPPKATRDAESLLFEKSRDQYSALVYVTPRVVNFEAGDWCRNCVGYFSMGWIKEG